jgi:hypothetical protein
MQKHENSSDMLSDMLSSRSYLDLSPERPQDLPRRELGPEIKQEPERSLRPRNKRAPKAPEIADQLAINRESAAPDRPARKRGRPRLETVKDAAAIEVGCDIISLRSTSLTPAGTSSTDPACPAHLPTKKGVNYPVSQISRRWARTDLGECV